MLEERDQRGGSRHDLLRRYVEEIHLFGSDLDDIALVAGVHGVFRQAPRLRIEGRVGAADVIVVLLVGGQIDDVFRLRGDHAVFDGAARRDQEAVLVEARVGTQRSHQTDVRTFGRLDGTDAAIVGVVNVAGFESGALAAQTAGAQGRKAAAVRQLRKRIVLIHELRQLSRTEELAQSGRQRTHVDQIAGHGLAEVGHSGHAFLGDALETQHADAQLTLQQFADGADAAVAEMVDVVDTLLADLGERHVVALLLRVAQGDQPLDNTDQIVERKQVLVFLQAQAEAAVQLVAPDAPQRVTAHVEEQFVEVFARALDAHGLVRPHAAQDLQQRFVGAVGVLLFKRGDEDRRYIPHFERRASLLP